MENQQPRPKRSKKNAQKFYIAVGELLGSYIVMRKVERVTKKCIEVLWECEHVITGKTIVARAAYLMEIDRKYKEKLKSNNYQYGLKNYLYNTTVTNSKRRGHECLLTFEEFINTILKDCYYCGESPKKSSNQVIKSRGNINEPPLYYNGVDRLDPGLGYVIGNVVPCCSKCNYMKHVSTEEEFYQQVKKVYEFIIIREGSTTIAKASTLQANGNGNGEPLTDNAEGEDIVSSI